MSNIGETNLTRLLASLTTTTYPSSSGDTLQFFVFTTLPPSTPIPLSIPLSAIEATISEPEGITIILPAEIARAHNLASVYPCLKITLNVHSSLEAVGFLAVITSRLKDAGISVNPVSGYYHDHLFIPVGRAAEAVSILEELAENAKKELEAEAIGEQRVIRQ